MKNWEQWDGAIIWQAGLGAFKQIAGIILANFKSLSTITHKNEVLNSIFSGVDKTDFSNLRMSTNMLKGPVAFPDFNLEISFSISSVVVG